MERMGVQRQVLHLRTRDHAAGWVASLVKLGFDPEPRRGLVCPINSTIVSKVRSGRPRQFFVM
jgi:hypothetical protein